MPTSRLLSDTEQHSRSEFPTSALPTRTRRRWRGGRFACVSLTRLRWRREGLTAPRCDDVAMNGDVRNMSMSVNHGFLKQLLLLQRLPRQSRLSSHSSTPSPQTPAASQFPRRKRPRIDSSPFPQRPAPTLRRFRSRLATIRQLSPGARIEMLSAATSRGERLLGFQSHVRQQSAATSMYC
jgi:hypothetical protein